MFQYLVFFLVLSRLFFLRFSECFPVITGLIQTSTLGIAIISQLFFKVFASGPLTVASGAL